MLFLVLGSRYTSLRRHDRFLVQLIFEKINMNQVGDETIILCYPKYLTNRIYVYTPTYKKNMKL